MLKRFAFTLTELTVALGIIGVVSALTIPAIVHNYQANAYTVKLRKVLNEISAAADLLITEEGKQHLDQTSLFTSPTGVADFFNNKFKVIRTCPASTTGCFQGTYRTINGGSSSFRCGNAHYMLANSASICPLLLPRANHTSLLLFEIDTNGPDAPNIGGRDMFYVALDSDAQIDVAPQTARSGSCTNSFAGQGCYQRLINNNWKMNY